MAAIAAKLDPNAEHRANIRQLEGRLQKEQDLYSNVLKPAMQKAAKMEAKTDEEKGIKAQLGISLEESAMRAEAASKKLVELDPTKERYAASVMNTAMREDAQKIGALSREMKAEISARDALAAEQRRVGRQRVKDFKANAEQIKPTPKYREKITYDNI